MFGTACGLSMSSNATSVVSVSQGKMSLGVVYAFTVVVHSEDMRTDSESVMISPVVSGSAPPTITTVINKFNPSSKLVLNSFLSASYAVTSTWSVYTGLGQILSITSLTNQSRSFTAADALSKINFPLSVDGGIFSGGNVYTFRLTVSPADNLQGTSFSEITLTANLAPSSGNIVSSPTNGSALVTQFLLFCPGWTADASSFPLSYGFSYSLYAASASLTLAASSLRAFTITALPSGLLAEKFMLTLQTKVTDIYFSFSTATTPVRVAPAVTTNVSQILTVSLATAFATGNINMAIQTVNNVSILFYAARFRHNIYVCQQEAY